jgi:hypothetical protein
MKRCIGEHPIVMIQYTLTAGSADAMNKGPRPYLRKREAKRKERTDNKIKTTAPSIHLLTAP